ncbi:MAG TPA: nucleotide disphospho-sugar-binding domain-containing protein [Actinophytocola sp.]|uniref:nucleotide disphospho-sugar-binding domain-containing protein n=1 Tax=Actinophytocola sp. TaxID=1872138 RepID=UPI002DB9432F|nr:nucleotide disphospho-sugar-binding domain-containing protein [Actinophytocola sp.]HEU5470752.1 nucleotide disphospho-sugar-binding domain-containing protein [Actinophytocola sp.]
MRVLFTVSSWPTHYASMIPLGWALQAMGHEVRVLCHASQVGQIGTAGLIPTPVLDGMDIVTSNRMQYYRDAVSGLWPYPFLPLHPLTGQRLGALGDFDVGAYRREVEPDLMARTNRGFDAAADFARRWQPDVVLHDPTSLEGLLAARLTEVPAALCLWGPVGTHEAEHFRIVPADPSGAFPRHGLGEFSLDMIEHVVDPCPAGVAPRTAATRLPVRYVPYNGSAPAPTWLLDPPARRPRICVTWSTALSTMSGPDTYLLPALVDALSGLDAEVLVTATAEDAAALGRVPPSVRVLGRLPVRLLLPSCDAVVHHGGSGTAMTALWSGKPQLAITFIAETALTGSRLAESGAGRHIPGHLFDPDTVRTAVTGLLTATSHRERAAELRDEVLLRPSMVNLVESLEKLACG